jgi:hypothetical protein
MRQEGGCCRISGLTHRSEDSICKGAVAKWVFAAAPFFTPIFKEKAAELMT